jgi:flagellar motor switch protein FliM
MKENYNNDIHYVYKATNTFNNVTEFAIALPHTMLVFSVHIFSLFSEFCFCVPLTLIETIFSQFSSDFSPPDYLNKENLR